MEDPNKKLILDIGCGSKKKPGSIGIDYSYSTGVDHVLNIENDALPFADESVDYIYSSHCFEHLKDEGVGNVWKEISRVAKNNATIEIWTPYPHTDQQWLIGHVAGWGPLRWDHLSSSHRDIYSNSFLDGGYWRWNEAQFVIKPETIKELDEMNIPHEFAIRHMNNICTEWGCFFSYVKEDPGIHAPKRSISLGGRYSCDEYVKFEGKRTELHAPKRNISLGGRYSCDEYVKFEKEKIRIEEELNAIKQSKIWRFFSLYRNIKDKLSR